MLSNGFLRFGFAPLLLVLPSCSSPLSSGSFPSSIDSSLEEGRPIVETKVSLGFSAAISERESTPLLDALNEEAKKQTERLGYSFVFSFAENGMDVVYQHSIQSHQFDSEAYMPLSASIKDRIRDTDYVKPVKDYLSSHLEEENLIPVAFYFDSLSYDPAIYGAEDIGDYGRLMEKMAEKEAHLIHTNTFFVSYLLGAKNLSIEDCGKMDGEGVPIWSDPSLEPFYKELNAKLNPPSAKQVLWEDPSNPRDKDIVAFGSTEGKGASFFPELALSTETIKPMSLGHISSVTFSKESNLGDKEKEALEVFFYEIGIKGMPYYKDAAPILSEDYEGNERYSSLKAEIESRVYMDLYHLDGPFYAVFDLAYQLGLPHSESFSFTEYYAQALRAIG